MAKTQREGRSRTHNARTKLGWFLKKCKSGLDFASPPPKQRGKKSVDGPRLCQPGKMGLSALAAPGGERGLRYREKPTRSRGDMLSGHRDSLAVARDTSSYSSFPPAPHLVGVPLRLFLSRPPRSKLSRDGGRGGQKKQRDETRNASREGRATRRERGGERERESMSAAPPRRTRFSEPRCVWCFCRPTG